MDGFAGGTLNFKLDRYHANSRELPSLEALLTSLKTAASRPEYDLQLTFNRHFIREDPAYARALETVVGETGVGTSNADYWWEDNITPDGSGYGSDAAYRRCRRGRDGRYLIWNTVFRTGVFVHRFFPGVAKTVARRWLPL
jgi:hypothetical protein